MMMTVHAGGRVSRLDLHRRSTFVRGAVKELPNTTRIIDAILPYFPLSCRVVSGYLDDKDLYWKVSYHWDLLHTQLSAFAARPAATDAERDRAAALRKVLATVPPNPPHGYALDKGLGVPVDHSTRIQTLARHRVLKKVKLEARDLFIAGAVLSPTKAAAPPSREKRYWLSVAKVANPRHGKHGTGFALDIAGDNVETARIARALGASLVFNEASHVHVEFANGVTPLR